MASMAPGAPRLPEEEMAGLRADVIAQIEELSTLVGDLVDLTRDEAGGVDPRTGRHVRGGRPLASSGFGRRRNDIEFDVSRHRMAGVRRRRRTGAGGAQPARQRREVEPARRAGRRPADADRPAACRTGGVRLRARVFRRRNAGWCSSGSTVRRRRARCPVRGWAWRSSNRLWSNTAARCGSRTPSPAGNHPGRRSTWCCPVGRFRRHATADMDEPVVSADNA